MRSPLPAIRTTVLAFAMLALPCLALAVPMPLDGTWIVLDENMDEGDFFTGTSPLAGVGPAPWTWNSPVAVVFDITDLFVVTDVFEVYDFGVLVLTTPSLPDWTVLGVPGPFTSPPWTNNPDVAWATAAFSKGSIVFAPGSHEITISDISIPPTACESSSCPDFGDGTVAFRAEAVPEPTSLLLLGIGLTGMALRRRRA